MTGLPGRRSWAVAGLVVVVLAGVGAALLAGALPGAPLRGGPLATGGSTEIQAPIGPEDTGVFWGVLEVRNSSGAVATLDSVQLDEQPDQVELLTAPYVWDDSRTEIFGAQGGISAFSLPLPDTYRQLPAKQQVKGFKVRPSSSGQVIFELATPPKASTVKGITVRYHVGWQAYEKTFDMTLIMCPPNDPGPCA